jgi:hypothetical protein
MARKGSAEGAPLQVARIILRRVLGALPRVNACVPRVSHQRAAIDDLPSRAIRESR